MEMFPRALVAPEVTFSTIDERLTEEYPVMEILQRALVAPAVTYSTIVVRSSAE